MAIYCVYVTKLISMLTGKTIQLQHQIYTLHRLQQQPKHSSNSHNIHFTVCIIKW